MNNSSPTHLDRGVVRRNLDEFSAAWRTIINGWRDSNASHTEKSHAQPFWSDLLRCFGVIPERIELFERDAKRASSGRTGYIDLFWSGVVIGEAKSLGKDLDAATTQALDYLAGGSIGQHEWPRYCIVTDFENLRVTKLGDDGWTVAFTVDEVPAHIDQLMFLAGQDTVTKKEEEEASIHASRLMADLYTAMLRDEEADELVGEDAPVDPEDEDWQVQRTSVFLTRILFLLYGDDAGLWEEDLFYRFVLHDTTGENLGARLNTLFQILNTPESRRRRTPKELEKFPYVNGSLFAEHAPQEFFDEDMRQALLAACRFHWTRISPAVFGSMFQLVKSKEARRADGEHYTSESNILKVIEPLFLDELRDEANRLIRNKSTTVKALRDFRDSLSEMIFLDPACGCGNFLVVAYREMRRIETDIIVALREKEHQVTASMDVSIDQRMNIGQFHGFELNWWPAKIAETAMFLVDHQANRELAAAVGDAPERLPITVTAHIRHGNALRMAWDTEIPRTSGKTYIFGNPPFAGHKERTAEQTKAMKKVWGSEYHGYLDFVTAWFKKSADFLVEVEGEFGFVSTNSISQGEQVFPLFSALRKQGWRLKFAHRTFQWDSEAPGQAAVHCVIEAFTRSTDVKQKLFSYDSPRGVAQENTVSSGINGYLVDAEPVEVSARHNSPLSPLLPKVNSGSNVVDWGFMVIKNRDELHQVNKDPIAAKYVRRYLGGREMINGIDRWILYLDELTPEDMEKSPEIRKRLTSIREKRAASPDQPTNQASQWPHRFLANRQPRSDYVGIPQTFSESRRYATIAHLDAEVIASMKLYTSEDPTGFLFGIMSSSMFITWQKTVGGRIKSDPSFSIILVWNTLPLPDVPPEQRQRIIRAGEEITKARKESAGRTLAQQYSPLAMDPALVKAHDKLDRLVDKAFGADRKLTTERQRLELLFSRYAEMTSTHASA